jgi:hypothetical protein
MAFPKSTSSFDAAWEFSEVAFFLSFFPKRERGDLREEEVFA